MQTKVRHLSGTTVQVEIAACDETAVADHLKIRRVWSWRVRLGRGYKLDRLGKLFAANFATKRRSHTLSEHRCILSDEELWPRCAQKPVDPCVNIGLVDTRRIQNTDIHEYIDFDSLICRLKQTKEC
jgi:hypothetical protein